MREALRVAVRAAARDSVRAAVRVAERVAAAVPVAVDSADEDGVIAGDGVAAGVRDIVSVGVAAAVGDDEAVPLTLGSRALTANSSERGVGAV